MTGPRLYSLRHREADLAFRVVRFDEAEIIQRRLMTLQFGVYTAQDADIDLTGSGSGLRIIADAPTDAFPDIGWLKQRFPAAHVAVQSNNRTVQAHLCSTGIGIALLPHAIGDRSPGLRQIVWDEPLPTRDVWMGYHRDLRGLHRLRAFIEQVEARYAS